MWLQNDRYSVGKDRISAIKKVCFGSVTVLGFANVVRVVKFVINGEKPFHGLVEVHCLT